VISLIDRFLFYFAGRIEFDDKAIVFLQIGEACDAGRGPSYQSRQHDMATHTRLFR
jgi:hypothetical protein